MSRQQLWRHQFTYLKLWPLLHRSWPKPHRCRTIRTNIPLFGMEEMCSVRETLNGLRSFCRVTYQSEKSCIFLFISADSVYLLSFAKPYCDFFSRRRMLPSTLPTWQTGASGFFRCALLTPPPAFPTTASFLMTFIFHHIPPSHPRLASKPV